MDEWLKNPPKQIDILAKIVDGVVTEIKASNPKKVLSSDQPDMSKGYLDAFASGAKSVTVLRAGSKPGLIYERKEEPVVIINSAGAHLTPEKRLSYKLKNPSSI